MLHRAATLRTAVSVAVCCLMFAATIAHAAPATAQSGSFTLNGRGWGHGIGMSQWGARGLAEKGYSAPSILGHYYSGTSVERKALPSSIRVGLLQERNEVWVEADGRFDLHDRAGTRRAVGAAGERWRVVPDADRLLVFKPGSSAPVFSTGVPVTVRWEQYGTLLKLPQTGHAYKRGRLDVDINKSTGKSRAILILGFEEYLWGLGEMPASWHTQALRAQAIAGRTYALEKVQRLGQSRSVCNCGVYASTADQAYVGRSHEVLRWTTAVKDTAGLVVTHGGQPIQALYSSSSGGHTENNEHVWGGTPLPYLRGRCDPGDFYSGANPHSNWTVTLTASEMSNRLRSAGHDVGTVRSVDALAPRGVSGRLRPVVDDARGGVRVTGTLGEQRLSGDRFRSVLGLKSSLVHHHIYGGIRARYDALKCRPGLPRSNEYTWHDLKGTARGRAQDFVKGRLFWNKDNHKVYWVRAHILAHYDLRRSRGRDLGMPRSNNVSVKGGKAGYFERGRIYWSRSNGAHALNGPILKKYLELGGPGSALGLPVSESYKVPGGRRVNFQNGFIKWNREKKRAAYRIT